MEFFVKSNRRNFVFLGLAMAAMLLVFWGFFGFHANNDTEQYIYSYEFFRGKDAPIYPNRYLNPFYPVLVAFVLPFLSPVGALIFLNLIFFGGIIILTYDLMRRIFKDSRPAFISALLVMTSYAIIRYALTQVQDMGGYFWYLAVVYTAWRWFEDKKIHWIILSGICTAFGLLTKESGAMGSLFFAVLLLFYSAPWRKKVWYFVLFSVWPFVTLVINKIRSADMNYDSLQWFVDNWKIYAPQNYNFTKWFGVNLSTFNLLWIFFMFGVYFLWRNRKTINRHLKIYLIAIIPGSLSYFAWPIFISRTVFICAWLVVPVAVYGFEKLYQGCGWKRAGAIAGLVLVLLSPAGLQHTLRYAHVFQIWDNCHHSIGCSWNYFWANRTTFSPEK